MTSNSSEVTAASTDGQPNWELIAKALFVRLRFALKNWKPSQTAMVSPEGLDAPEFITIDEYLLQGLEQFPGYKADREILALRYLHPSKQAKAYKELMARRALGEVLQVSGSIGAES